MGAPNRTLSSFPENRGGRTGTEQLWGSEDDPKLTASGANDALIVGFGRGRARSGKTEGARPLPAIRSTLRVTRSPKAIRLIACAGRDVRLAV